MTASGVQAELAGACADIRVADSADTILGVSARYVAAPTSTLDIRTPTGEHIPIEQRDPREVTELRGMHTAPDGTQAANPAFDVTPARLITAIVTERGALRPPFERAITAATSQPQAAPT